MSRAMSWRRRHAHAAAGLVLASGLMLALTLVPPARAQTPPGVSPPAKSTGTAPQQPATPDPLCTAQGAGFVRLEGTRTCLKVDGYVQMDSATQNAPAAGLPGALSPALQSR